MGLVVYLDPFTINCRKVLAGLDMMGVPYEVKNISYLKGEHKEPDYLKVNPCATIPAATDGDGPAITESNAILMYAADLDASGHKEYPKDGKLRAQVNRWLLWESSVWFASCYIYLIENVVNPLLGGKTNVAALAAEAPNWNKLAKVLDDQLAKTKWLCGDQITIADIAVAAPMHVPVESKFPLDKYPNLKRWMFDGIQKQPYWQKTHGAVNEVLQLKGSEVHATLNYTKNVDPKLTELYFYETADAVGIHEPGDAAHSVAIHDGWPRAKEFSVDKEGFSLEDFNTKYTDWEDEANMQSQFYPEVVEFLKNKFGAKRVLVFDHTIRTKANDQKKLTQESNTSQRAPVMLVHCDYTSESGPTRVKQLLPDEADDLLSRRVVFINVWKPIHNTVKERPLAMCDVTSSPPSDFFKLHLRYRDRNGENYVMQHSPEHKWYYFPEITPEKVILLKTFDSETDGRARFVGHSAFEDPTTPADAPVRESVEIRTILFF